MACVSYTVYVLTCILSVVHCRKSAICLHEHTHSLTHTHTHTHTRTHTHTHTHTHAHTYTHTCTHTHTRSMLIRTTLMLWHLPTIPRTSSPQAVMMESARSAINLHDSLVVPRHSNTAKAEVSSVYYTCC